MRIFVLSALIALATPAYSDTFMPENNLDQEDHKHFMDSSIDEKLFNDIIDQADKIYKPIIEKHGGKLTFSRGWDDPTVNASAQQMGSTWQVNMYGGLARRPEVTPDGFALVVCHEIGHHLAGYAFYDDTDWASSEGQSDYFATVTCGRLLWGDQKEENAKYRKTAHKTVLAKCDEQWKTEDEQNLCYRQSMAGYSLANLLGTLGGQKVDFDKPDTKEVSTTDPTHPAGQCRLDTYFAGALCTAKFDPSVIPGRSHAEGQTSYEAQMEAAKASCMEGYKAAVRPRCWFAPVTKGSAKPIMEDRDIHAPVL